MANESLLSPAIEMEMLEVLLDREEQAEGGETTENTFSMNEMSNFLASTTDFGVRKPKGKRRYPEPKEEIEYLKIKYNELQEQLQLLKSQHVIVALEDPWKGRAIEQAQLTYQSIQENSKLKADVRDQMQLIQALERVLQKRPRISSFPSYRAAWKQGVLGVENREADLERLLKYHYDRIDSECIRYKMHDAKESGDILRKAFVETSDTENIMQFRAINCMKMFFNFVGVSDLVWDDKTENHILHSFHPDLVYVRDYAKLPDPTMPTLEARIAVRRYVELNKVVILWCSILEDQLIPHDPNNYIDNRSGWIAIHLIDENTSFLQSIVTQTTPSIPEHLELIQPIVGTLTELMLQAWDLTFRESWKTTQIKTTSAWLSDMHRRRQTKEK